MSHRTTFLYVEASVKFGGDPICMVILFPKHCPCAHLAHILLQVFLNCCSFYYVLGWWFKWFAHLVATDHIRVCMSDIVLICFE